MNDGMATERIPAEGRDRLPGSPHGDRLDRVSRGRPRRPRPRGDAGVLRETAPAQSGYQGLAHSMETNPRGAATATDPCVPGIRGEKPYGSTSEKLSVTLCISASE